MSTVPGLASSRWAMGGYSYVVVVPTGYDWRLADALGNPADAVSYLMIVPTDTIASATSPTRAAVDCSTGIHPDSTGQWLVLGRITGAGGKGGDGPTYSSFLRRNESPPASNNFPLPSSAGRGGGGGGAGSNLGTGGVSNKTTVPDGHGADGSDTNELVGSNPPSYYVGGAPGVGAGSQFEQWGYADESRVDSALDYGVWTYVKDNMWRKAESGGDAIWLNHEVTAVNAGSEIWGGGGGGSPGWLHVTDIGLHGYGFGPGEWAASDGGTGGAPGQAGSVGAYFDLSVYWSSIPSLINPDPWPGYLTDEFYWNPSVGWTAGEPGDGGYAIRLHDGAAAPTLLAGSASPLIEGAIG